MDTLWIGRSLGMHRILIHQAFNGYPSLRLLLVYLGTLVGLGGPIAMTQTHELRDWSTLGAATRGHSLSGLGLVTFSEGWHSNHHAFPRSARIGLIWDVQTPDTLPKRDRVLRVIN